MVRLHISSGSGSTLTSNPVPASLDHDLRVLAPQRAFQCLSPSASAARISARFVMLFEPGTVISARTGLSSGTISMRSGSDITQMDRIQDGGWRIEDGNCARLGWVFHHPSINFRPFSLVYSGDGEAQPAHQLSRRCLAVSKNFAMAFASPFFTRR